MRNLTKAMILMSLFTIVGCQPDDDYMSSSLPEAQVTEDPKLYTTTLGTYITIENDNYEFSDPKGSLNIKIDNGSSLLAANMAGSIFGNITYEVIGIDGDIDIKEEELSSAFRTDANGDFESDILYDTSKGEAVRGIVSVNAIVAVMENDTVYERKLKYSKDSIWDVVMGLGSALFKYKIKKHHSDYSSYYNELAQSFDINADIELTKALDQKMSKSAIKKAHSKTSIRTRR